jgi:ubiquinone/menaquinone biosynthesis C-methylase UbiE
MRKLFEWGMKAYIWATYRLYDELAWSYDLVSWLVSLGQWSKVRLESLDYVRGERVLEIGFGTGELLMAMKDRYDFVCGLEFSTAMQRITARKMRRRKLSVPRLMAKAQHMPFADGSFDTIVSTFPAGYILYPQTMSEAYRLLHDASSASERPAGRLVIAGASLHINSPLVRQKMKQILGEAPGDVFSEFERLAVNAGFQVQIIPGKGTWISAPLILLEKTSRSPLSQKISV